MALISLHKENSVNRKRTCWFVVVIFLIILAICETTILVVWCANRPEIIHDETSDEQQNEATAEEVWNITLSLLIGLEMIIVCLMVCSICYYIKAKKNCKISPAESQLFYESYGYSDVDYKINNRSKKVQDEQNDQIHNIDVL